mgnify:CR=1 FL=1|tara:strand:+ start:28361 stop:29623 length:1263 start_codon:yes stop_codon:yes gene_type:complete
MTLKVLDVYLNNAFTGKLIQNDSGVLSFEYDAEYIQTKQAAISVSLPLSVDEYKGDMVKAFFSGLLPEETIREKIAKYLGVSEKNPFALLKAIGGECAGALSLVPEGEVLTSESLDDIQVLNDQELIDLLDLIKRRPMLAGEEKIRLSLAGAQNKLAVSYKDNTVSLVGGAMPTTHILKPMIEHVDDSVHNEYFCMKLAKMVGLSVPDVYLHFAGDTPCYLIERYDRVQNEDGHTVRIHQEDFCQVLGILPEVKYEREGGPNLKTCFELINRYSSKPAVDQIRMLQVTIFNYLIGNVDAHGKNFSFLYTGQKPELSPAYDLLSTAIYPDLSNKMAMKIGGRYKADELCLRHWHRLVPDTKAAESNLEKQLLTLSEKCLEHSTTLKGNLEGRGLSSNVFDSICEVIQKRANDIKVQLDLNS